MFGYLGDFGIAERALPHRAFGAQAIFLLLLTLHKLFIMQQFFNLLLLLLSPVCTIFCAQVNDSGRAVLSPRRTDIPRHLGWTGGFVNTSLTHAGDFGGRHWSRYVTSSECRALRSATLGLGAETLSRTKLGPRHQCRTH